MGNKRYDVLVLWGSSLQKLLIENVELRVALSFIQAYVTDFPQECKDGLILKERN